MTENQKLREALQAISHIDDTTNHAVDASAALDRIGQIARQALALPTAAPVGELPELPEPAAWRTPDEWPMCYQYTHEEPDAERIQWAARYGRKHEQVFTADQMRAYARAALRAGDAVDAQRLDFIEKSARCDPKMDGQHVWWPTSLNKALKGPTLRDAIDAAIRARGEAV